MISGWKLILLLGGIILVSWAVMLALWFGVLWLIERYWP